MGNYQFRACTGPAAMFEDVFLVFIPEIPEG
jgi:hypothetical protein